MLFICYPPCTTCQKALKWLDDLNIAYEFRDISSQGGRIFLSRDIDPWVNT